MVTITYRWRVIEEGLEPGPWKMKGKELPWRMTEESARSHEVVTGRVLEKVPGSAEERADPGNWSTP